MLTLLALTAALRVSGAALRTLRFEGFRLGGWLLCILAVWTAAGAAGIWIPLWTVVPVAVGGWALEALTQDPRWLAGGDVLLVSLMAVGATPPPEWSRLAVLAAGLTVLGAGAEAWARLTPPSLRNATPMLGVLAAAALGGRLVGEGDPLKPLPQILPSLAMAPPCQGERVELAGGAVAWYDRPRGRSSHPGAVILHGADPRGSAQPSACSLRRALNTAGFATLALDHPGYGESSAPPADAPLAAWDPGPAEVQAVEALEARSEVDSVVVVAGHSMGGTAAMRLLSARPDIPLAVVFGVGLTDVDERADYWYQRFHEDRGLEAEMPRDRWWAIRRSYYDFERAAGEVPRGGGHVVFATFGLEWENVAETRRDAYAAIGGSKEAWHLPRVSHEFNAFSWHGLVVASGRATRTVAHGIQARVWHRRPHLPPAAAHALPPFPAPRPPQPREGPRAEKRRLPTPRLRSGAAT